MVARLAIVAAQIGGVAHAGTASCEVRGQPMVFEADKRPQSVRLAVYADVTAVAWLDEVGARIVASDAEGHEILALRDVNPRLDQEIDLALFADARGFVVVTRTSSFSKRSPSTIQATRWNEKGKRVERRQLGEHACGVEQPCMAATLNDETLFVAYTSAPDEPGAHAKDLRMARWAPAPALPQSLDALFTEDHATVHDLTATEDGMVLLWATGDGALVWRGAILDENGIPRGPGKRFIETFGPTVLATATGVVARIDEPQAASSLRHIPFGASGTPLREGVSPQADLRRNDGFSYLVEPGEEGLHRVSVLGGDALEGHVLRLPGDTVVIDGEHGAAARVEGTTITVSRLSCDQQSKVPSQ